MWKQEISRRSALSLAMVSGIATVGLAACSKGDAPRATTGSDTGTLDIVSLFPISGPAAEDGKHCNEGVRLAASEFNKATNRDVKVHEFDTKGSIDEAVKRCREALDQGYRLFTAETSSNIALALSEIINKAGGVLTTGVGADAITGEECRTSTIRWATPTYGDIAETVGPLMKDRPELKRWYTVTPKYVFGEGLLAAAKEFIAQGGGQHVGNSYHALDETEFSAYLNNAVSQEPDVLLLLNFGGQSTTCFKQAVSFGLKKKMTLMMAVSSGIDQYRALGPDALADAYVGAAYYHRLDNERNKQFVTSYQSVYSRNPGTLTAQGYEGCRMILEGVAKAASTDPRAILEALQGYTYDALTGPAEIRADDNQLLKDYLLLKGKASVNMDDDDDFFDIVSSGQTYKSPKEAGCDALVPLGS